MSQPKIKLSEFTEETIWHFDCPTCSGNNSTKDNPDMHNAHAVCEHCGDVFEIVQ